MIPRRRNKPTREVTTTANIPVYFPGKRLDNDDDNDDNDDTAEKFIKNKLKQDLNKDEQMLTQAQLALKLVETFGLSPRLALEVVVEEKASKAAEFVAENIKDKSRKASVIKKVSEEISNLISSAQGGFRFKEEEDEIDPVTGKPKKKDDEEDEIDPVTGKPKVKEEEEDEIDPVTGKPKKKDDDEEEDDADNADGGSL